MSLRGRHAVVTGAGSGIGRATAERLAEAGCQVTVTGRHIGRLNETVDRIGDLAFAAPADVTAPDALAAAVEVGRDRFGPIDILVNNAGGPVAGFPMTPFVDTDPGCIRVADIDLKVSFPLVGRAVENAIASGLREHLDDEVVIIEQYLRAKAA